MNTLADTLSGWTKNILPKPPQNTEVIKGFRLILGHFSSSMTKLAAETDAEDYYDLRYRAFSHIEITEEQQSHGLYSIISTIAKAIVVSEEIIFDMTWVQLPFNSRVYTLLELDFIIKYRYTEKTKFYVEGKLICTEIVEYWWKKQFHGVVMFKNLTRDNVWKTEENVCADYESWDDTSMVCG